MTIIIWGDVTGEFAASVTNGFIYTGSYSAKNGDPTSQFLFKKI